MRRAKQGHAVLIGAALGVLAYACSTGSEQGLSGGEAGNGQGGGAGTRNHGAAGLILSGPDASGGAALDPGAACAIGTAEAALRPVSILVMFDRSNSMVRPASVDPVTMMNRWQTATGALKTFIADQAAAGLGLALRFFPDDRPAAGCTLEGCDSAACAAPLVEVGLLSAPPAPADAHEARLLEAIDGATPELPTSGMPATGGTPISAALDGALIWAAERQRQHPEGRAVVLFVTDGAPSGCDERIATIAGLAESALAASGVATYAIGLADAAGEGVNEEDMDAIAEAGGTERAYFVKDGPSAAGDLLAALTAIHRQALPCDFPMPETTSEGEEIDPELLNVTYTSGAGIDSLFTRVSDAETCSDSLSWFYDNEGAPTRVLLCPAACELVASDPNARFEILAGCAPILEPPK